ncbi:unnamed protein product [Pocillopora meandrina]|uniref:Uncharacterized protein n=1 Tax=Pocillopora meandrina TaxID=46732 RepID=A0AAU9VPI2_9CNID|nr:unnamed protein product [Pocillopora meandrina]
MLPTKFVVQPSESLKCPICRELFKDPVISTQCGHTFCRNCIRNGVSLTGNATTKCPLDGTILQRTHLVSNLAVRGQIEDLLIHCRHGLTRSDSEEDFDIDSSGCQERISFGRRREHEDLCGFALVPCPNSSNQCGKFRRKCLEEHLKVCAQYRCQYSVKGCEHVGTKQNVEEHAEECKFKHSSDLIKCQALHSESSEELRSSIKVLSDRVSWLESHQDALVTQVEQCNSAVSRLSETVEDLAFQVEQLSVILKRSSLYRETSITSIPETINSSQSTSPDDTTSYSHAHKSLVRLKTSPAAHQDVWGIPCVFKCIGTLRGHRGTIWSMVSKGHRLFSAGGDQVIKVWNMENVRLAKCTEVLEGHADDIHTMCVGGGKLYSAGSDQAIISWNLENLTLHKKIENAHDNIICAIVYNGQYLFTSSHSCIKVWDASSLEEVHEMTDLHHWVRALALDAKREKLYSGSHNVVHIWDATGSFDLRGTIDHSLGSVYSLAVTKHFILVGTYNQNIHVYDVNTYQSIKALVGHIGTVTGLAPAVTGKLLFSASYDTTVQVWNLDTMLPMQTLSRHEGSVNCVVIHKDMLLSGSEDMEIKVFKYFKAE